MIQTALNRLKNEIKAHERALKFAESKPGTTAKELKNIRAKIADKKLLVEVVERTLNK